MQTQLKQRIEVLKVEFNAGQQMLAELAAKQATLQQILLRISGAIQVLEEELATAAPPAADLATAPSEAPVASGHYVSA